VNAGVFHRFQLCEIEAGHQRFEIVPVDAVALDAHHEPITEDEAKFRSRLSSTSAQHGSAVLPSRSLEVIVVFLFFPHVCRTGRRNQTASPPDILQLAGRAVLVETQVRSRGDRCRQRLGV
jgi:hypothetical protein